MKLLLKILKILAIIILTISLTMFIASYFMQDKVADIVLKSFNKNLSTKLDIGSFRLSFLRKFPKASLELKDVLVHSSSDFKSSAFAGISTDTLLSARSVSVEFRITDIIKGIYNIQRVSARVGKMNFFTDVSGHVNYDVSVKTENQNSANTTIDLERINLADFNIYYNNLATNLIINGIVNNGRLKSRISDDIIDFTAVADMRINRVQLYSTIISKTITSSIDFTLQSSKSGIIFKKGSMSVDNYDFGLEGFISSENVIDLHLFGNNIDIEKIRNYLPEKYAEIVSEYDPSGILVIDCTLKGPLTRTTNPHIEVNSKFSHGKIIYGKSEIKINDLSFEGSFSNGARNLPESSTVTISNLTAVLGSARYTGELKLSDFANPKFSLTLKGTVKPGELKEFFDLQNISNTGGSADIDITLAGSMRDNNKYSLSDIIKLNPRGVLIFNSFSAGLQKENIVFSNMNGILNVSNTIKASKLQLTYKGQRINIDGEFRNLPEWLTDNPVPLIATANVSFSRFIPEIFLNDFHISDSSSKDKTAFRMPDNMILDIGFKIDSLNYKTFSSSNVAGELSYKPGLLTFKSLNLNSLDGVISGNGFIIQNGNKSVIARGSFHVNDIDVNKAFVTFHNFGQNFMKAENLKGSLSGTLSLLLPLDSMLNPQIKSLTAEGKYIITDGVLINFDPIKQLSTFIELSELENISFRQFENDFYIRNNYLYIPQMDVRSSAADLSVNGKHSFDNDYEYHVKILLSELLSRKRKKSKTSDSEFGVIEDDGLGRTSMLLKITGKGEEIKVGYDVKAAGTTVKSNLNKERQTLKTILNQEYGWFKKDSVPKPKPAEKKPKVRIIWDEADSVQTIPVSPSGKKK